MKDFAALDLQHGGKSADISSYHIYIWYDEITSMSPYVYRVSFDNSFVTVDLELFSNFIRPTSWTFSNFFLHIKLITSNLITINGKNWPVYNPV